MTTQKKWRNIALAVFFILSSCSEAPKFPSESEFDNPRETDTGSIVYTSNEDGDYDIWVMQLDNLQRTKLTNNDQRDQDPVWSSDRTKIAFVSNRDGLENIYIMPADGGGEDRLDPIIQSVPGVSNIKPSWSPDDKFIVYQKHIEMQGMEIWYVDIANNIEHQVTSLPADSNCFFPIWSPNNLNEIIYTGGTTRYVNISTGIDGRKIYSINRDGSMKRRLRGTNSDCYSPIFSRDGSKIFFTAYYNGSSSYNIYSIDSGGGNSNIALESFSDSDAWISISSNNEKAVFARSNNLQNEKVDLFIGDITEDNKVIDVRQITFGNGSYMNSHPDWR